MNRHAISDEKWAIIGPLLSKRRKDPRGRKSKDDRQMFDAVLWIMKTGSPWRDLPPEFGAGQTVYKRFWQWAKLGIWDEVLAELSRGADPEAIMIERLAPLVGQSGGVDKVESADNHHAALMPFDHPWACPGMVGGNPRYTSFGVRSSRLECPLSKL